MPIHKTVNKNFFKKWTPDMAYVLGFFFADGTYDVSARGSHYFGFHICDKTLLLAIKKVLQSEHKIASRTVMPGESPRYRIQIGSKEMCDDLHTLGARVGKTWRLRLPDMPQHCFPHFVRGYFDGDGHVWSGLMNKHRKKPVPVLQVGFTSCSRAFLTDLYKELRQFGLKKGGVYCKKNAFCIKYSTADAKMLYEIMYGALGSKDLFLPRKKQIFDTFLSKRNILRE